MPDRFVIQRADGKYHSMWGPTPKAHADGVFQFGTKQEAETYMVQERMHEATAVPLPPKADPGTALPSTPFFSRG